MKRVTLFLFALAATSLGCMVPVGDDALGDASQDALLTPDGVSLNGVSLNGVSLNGVSLNGVSLNGTGLNSVSLDSISLASGNLNGAPLGGISLTSSTLSAASLPGSHLVGTHWSGTLSTGDALSLRIDATTVLPAPNEDVRSYDVSFATPAGWMPLCGNDADGKSIAAIALSGVWSYERGVPGGGGFTPSASQFTFACRKTAIAKCVEFGYKPWIAIAGEVNGYPDHLVSCTRMLRADYCGDGRSFTVNGTPVNIYDNSGIQADTEAWSIEAEWTASGARCTNEAQFTRLTVSGLAPPSCFAAKIQKSCGALEHFNSGTVLMNEFAH
jgi:hypothetical protein